MPLPAEVWWNVIDQLANVDNVYDYWEQQHRYEWHTLLACARVCRVWAQRSRHHLRKRVVFDRPERVARLAKLAQTGLWELELCKIVEIRAASLSRTLSLFAVMFGKKMPRLEWLVMAKETWSEYLQPGDLHADVFHYLSTFTSITHLSLFNITFPNVQTFGRLLFALPSLTSLHFDDTIIKARKYNPGTLIQRPHNLTTLRIPTSYDADDIINFLVTTEMASTLKELVLDLDQHPLSSMRDESGHSALLSSAGTSLLSLRVMHWFFRDHPLPPVVSFTNLVNLTHFAFDIRVVHPFDDDKLLPDVTPWICNHLAGLPTSLTALRNFTLRLIIHVKLSRDPPKDRAVHQRSKAQACKLLDDLLSMPPFMDLEQFVFEIRTLEMNATYSDHLQQLAPLRFPKLYARGVLSCRFVETKFPDYILEDLMPVYNESEHSDQFTDWELL